MCVDGAKRPRGWVENEKQGGKRLGVRCSIDLFVE